jgi:hypothetical protein
METKVGSSSEVDEAIKEKTMRLTGAVAELLRNEFKFVTDESLSVTMNVMVHTMSNIILNLPKSAREGVIRGTMSCLIQNVKSQQEEV